jgi:hypothetical protein
MNDPFFGTEIDEFGEPKRGCLMHSDIEKPNGPVEPGEKPQQRWHQVDPEVLARHLALAQSRADSYYVKIPLRQSDREQIHEEFGCVGLEERDVGTGARGTRLHLAALQIVALHTQPLSATPGSRQGSIQGQLPPDLQHQE